MVSTLNELYAFLLESNIYLIIISQIQHSDVLAPCIVVPYSFKEFFKVTDKNGDISKYNISIKDELIERDILLHNAPESEREFYREGFSEAFRVYDNIVNTLLPAYGMVWGSTFPQSLLLREVLRNKGIPVFVIERGLLPQTVMVEFNGHGVESSIFTDNDLWSQWKKTYEEKRYSLIKKYYLSNRPEKYNQGQFRTLYEIRRKYNITEKNVILFLGQHDGWSGLLPRNCELSYKNSPWFSSTKEALKALLTTITQFDDTVLIFKPHPHDRVTYDDISHSQLRIITDENLHSLLSLADIVAAISTTAQFEALLYEKPIVLLGNSQLSGKGIAYEYNENIDLKVLVEQALTRENFGEHQFYGKVFIDGIFQNFLYATNEKVPTRYRIKDLARRIESEALTEQNTNFNPSDICSLNSMLAPYSIQISQADKNLKTFSQQQVDPKLIAFYLPQFHPIPENDQWWGRGFTEWTNVTKAVPLFNGHHQPHLPSELGFYDLRLPEVRRAQAELAREYGISGFCYWHYWFNGKQLLEYPVNAVLESGEPDFPFCLAWANEHWSRRWNGMDQEVLQEQVYGGEEDDRIHFRYLLNAFKDPRYIKIDGKPLFLIYNPAHLLNPRKTLSLWRELLKKEGMNNLFCIAIKSHTESYLKNWCEEGFDAELIFQPQWSLIGEDSIYEKKHCIYPKKVGDELKDLIVGDYSRLWKEFARMNVTSRCYPTVVPRWDNSPRRQRQPVILYNSSPEEYQRWLTFELQQVKEKYPEDPLVFINAWNEWAEGNHLEPDMKYRRAFLEATKKAQVASPENIAECYCDVAISALRHNDEKLANDLIKASHKYLPPEEIKKILDTKLKKYNTDIRIQNAVAEFRLGNFSAAKQLLEKLLSEQTDEDLLRINLACVYFELQQYSKAIELLTPLLSVTEQSYVWVLAGECFEAMNNFQQAIAAYTKAIAEPGDPYKCKARIEALCNQQRDDALQIINELTSIIILTYNNSNYTKECLDSVFQWTDVPFELIIVDNGSTDNTVQLLDNYARSYSNITIIRNLVNKGFPAGVNQALHNARGEYIILLNNDVVVTKGWLRHLIETAKQNDKIGIVGAVTNNISGWQKDNSAWYVSKEHMQFHAEQTARNYRGEYYETTRVRFFCTLLTRSLLTKIGGLDEIFTPGNYEDDDYCLRAQLAGYSIVIARGVFVHHYGSASFTAEGKEAFQNVLIENLKKFKAKWGITPEEIGAGSKHFRQSPVEYPLCNDELRETIERALYYVHCNNLLWAVEWFEKAFVISEESGRWVTDVISKEDAYNLVGKIYLSFENLEKAKYCFEKELQLNPQSSRACTELGRIFWLAGLYKQAKVMYEWAVVYNQNNERAIKGLQQCNKELGFADEHNTLLENETQIAQEN